jgi:hypothetical protein
MASPSQAPVNQVAAYAIAILGVLLGAYTVIGSLANFGAANDLPEFYTGAYLLAHGQAGQIYNLPAIFAQEKILFPSLARGIGLFVPPPAVPLLLPLLLMPVGWSPAIWTIVLTAALGASVWLIIDWLKLSKQESLWLLGLVALSGPAVEALRIGQPAPLMLLALVAFVRLAERLPFAAGAVLAVMMLKPQQLLPVFVYLGAGLKQKHFAALFSALVILFFISLMIFGTAGFSSYVATVSDPANVQYMQPQLNPTVRGQLMRLSGINTTVVNGIAFGALLLSTIAIALVAWRTRNHSDWLTICLCVAMPLGLVTSLHCHDYDLLFLLPGMVLLTRTQLWTQMGIWAKTAMMLGLSTFLIPFYSDIHYGYLLAGGLINPHFVLIALLALFLLVAAWRTPERFSRAETL